VHLSEESPRSKVDLLVLMIRKLYLFVSGEVVEDNSDSLMNQEVLLPGHLYLMVVKEKMQVGLDGGGEGRGGGGGAACFSCGWCCWSMSVVYVIVVMHHSCGVLHALGSTAASSKATQLLCWSAAPVLDVYV
jgi:hypothetical protein